MSDLTIRNAVIEIRNGKRKPLYILNGSDYYLQSLFIDELFNFFKNKVEIEKCFFSSDSYNISSLILDLKMDSLFNTHKLYVLNNPSRIIGKEKDDLINYCKNPNSNHTLIFLFDRMENKSVSFKSISKFFTTVNTSTPFPNKINSWLDYILKKNKLSASFEAKNLLIDLYGDSLSHLSLQIEKIKINNNSNNEISKEFIIQLSGWKKNYFPWHLLDSIGNKNLEKSVIICNSLIDQGVEPTFILNQLIVFFIEIYFSYSNIYDNSKVGWLNKIIQNNIPKYLKNYNKNQIESFLKLLLNYDEMMKTSSANKKHLIVKLLFKIQINNEK